MIQSLNIKNFLSFKNEVAFSFKATKDSHLEESHVVEVAKGVRLQKIGVVYGYNASGKSNLIEAFQFLRSFWFSIPENKDEETGIIPFKLDHNSRNTPSEFKLIFYYNTIKYSYSLVINEDIVINEKLDFYPSVQPSSIFERTNDDGVSVINFGNKIKVSSVAREELTIKCLSNSSVFAALNQVNVKIKELDDAATWMKNQVMQSIEPLTRLQDFTETLVMEKEEYKNQILSYLQKADFNISEIHSSEFEQKIPEDFIRDAKNMGMPSKELERLEKERIIKMPKTEFGHSVVNNDIKEVFNLPIEWQSDGTKRVFGLSGAIFKAIERQAFLSIDEIESKLHPRLIEYVIEQFIRSSEQAQLLVTTHYDNLFDESDLLRNDSFWFTEKGDDGSTKLYPLSEFNGLKRISSLQKAYKFGKFGAVPNID
ncbi:MAG: ATP-binding protein [Bacteroidales bacterium]|jgi:AAA15 family ATPase/GTPase|nr:ATP-binding protein [Bacteroidales bacterium]